MINRIGNVFFDTNMQDGRNGLKHIGDSEKYTIREWLDDEISLVKAEMSWQEREQDKEELKNKLMFLGRVASGLTQAYYNFNISVMEPAIARGKKEEECVRYQAGLPIYSGIHCMNWEALFEKLVPNGRSHLANLFELDLLLAWEIAEGVLTLEEVVVDSSYVGGYTSLEPRATSLTGQIKCGKFFDGFGNTKKIVKNGNQFVVVGGSHGCDGKISPIASYRPWNEDRGILSDYTGVLVIKD